MKKIILLFFISISLFAQISDSWTTEQKQFARKGDIKDSLDVLESNYSTSFSTTTLASPTIVEGTHDRDNVLVCIGDSRTAGYPSSPYPSQLTLSDFTIYNKGVGGSTGWEGDSTSVYNVDKYYSSWSEYNIAVIWYGYNDFTEYDHSVNETYNRISAIAKARQEKGFDVFVCTEISIPWSSEGNGLSDSLRLELNTLIRENYQSFASGFIDLAANTNLGDVGDYNDTTYFYDKVHLTAAGYALVAGMVQDEIENFILRDGLPNKLVLKANKIPDTFMDMDFSNSGLLTLTGASAYSIDQKLQIKSSNTTIDSDLNNLYLKAQASGVYTQIAGDTKFYVNSLGVYSSSDFHLTTKTPASATATGTAGTIAWDADYIYICIATNTWKRIAISTW